MNGLRAALTFLTILPAGARRGGADGGRGALAAARAWFPAVGLLLGAAMAGLDLLFALVSPRPGRGPGLGAGAATSAEATLATALLAAALLNYRAGGLDPRTAPGRVHGHLRRAARGIQPRPAPGDSARLPRRRVRRGGAGVPAADQGGVRGHAGGRGGARFGVLLLFPCLSRWAMLVATVIFPYVRERGSGTPFAGGNGRSGAVRGNRHPP